MAQDGSGQTPALVVPAPRSTPVGPLQHYMEPRSFAGKAGEDVDEWLTHYARVSRYNRWDSVTQLEYVVLFLSETALMWYENHEDSLTTWERFVEEIKKCFGDSYAKQKRAERTLAQRAQAPGETCTTYIEEILKLCKIVNSQMSEEDRVGHLLKGIAEDVYNFLIGREHVDSVSDVVRHCRTFETLKTRRIAPKFGRLANVTTVASVDESPSADLSSTIRQIVREELLRHEVLTCNVMQPPVAYSSQPMSPAAPCTSWQPSVCVTDIHPRGAPGPHQGAFTPDQRHEEHPRPSRFAHWPTVPPVQQAQPLHSATRPPTAERVEAQFIDRRLPVCYSCGDLGHIARYCNRRQPPRFERSTMSRRYRTPHETYSPSHAYPGRIPHQRPEVLRNRSPASDRSLTPPPAPRVSRSPSPRRRYPSPPPEN